MIIRHIWYSTDKGGKRIFKRNKLRITALKYGRISRKFHKPRIIEAHGLDEGGRIMRNINKMILWNSINKPTLLDVMIY